MSCSKRWSRVLSGLIVATALASVHPAAAQNCGSDPGYFITFTFPSGPIPGTQDDVCAEDSFFCAMPESSGGYVRKSNAGCDPETGACAIELRFPLEFRGNEDNIDKVGLSSAPTPGIYWFQGAADPDCRPWLEVECDQISVCGLSGIQIRTDFTETYLRLGEASCKDPIPSLHAGTFSIMAFSCPSRFSCPMWTFDSSDLTPAAVKKGLGCVDPPKQDCESCMACPLPGVPADGDGPRIGGEELGAGGGAYLYYAAGGAGFPGLPGSTSWVTTLGRGWSHDYAERIVRFPGEDRVFLITRTGVFREWTQPDASGVYQEASPSSEKRSLTWLGTGAGWTFRELNGTLHTFDGDGKWRSTALPGRPAVAKVAQYDASGNLESVGFPDERREDFTYYPVGDPSEGKLQSITEVGIDNLTTRTWEYKWTGDDLTRVDRPDGTALELFYDATFPGYLIRIELVADVSPAEESDPENRRVVRAYEYSPEGRVTKTWRGDASPTGPEAVDLWTLDLDDPDDPTVATVTPPVGAAATYTLGRDTVSSNVKVVSISGDCPVCGLGPNVTMKYENPENPMLPSRIIDARGTWTDFEYDAFGQLTMRIDAANDPDDDPDLPRETIWEYHPDFHTSPTLVRGPTPMGDVATREVVTFYDALTGDVETRTIQGLESTFPTGSFQLETDPEPNSVGQPLTIDPPGHGKDDVTSYTYTADRGFFFPDTRTDPIVGTTTFGYDPFNRRTAITDPNGLVMKTSYDDRDRVAEVRQEGANPPVDDLVTTYRYTPFKDLFQIELPRGNVTEYGYDDAGRLTSVERKHLDGSPGERVFYTLDAAGNRTLEELQRWDDEAVPPGWTTVGSTEYRYSNRCQVDQIVRAPGQAEEAVTSFEYDCNGNLSAQWDANHDPEVDPPTTSYGYDALDRLTNVSQPWAPAGVPAGDAMTSYDYDVQDHLTKVTDSEGNVTEYTYSDRDLLTYELSSAHVDPAATCNPAPTCDLGCGCTVHGYDEHGELVTTTDARGVTVTRTVDPLDRVTFLNYPDDSLDTDYDYDTEPASCAGTSFEIGRLGSITRDGETIESCYDRFGRVTRGGELTYGYDANGNRTGIGYPGNVAATYGFDFADREESLTVTSPGGTESVVTAAAYLPSGPLSGLTLGSGPGQRSETRAFDGRYAPRGIGLSGPAGGVGERTWRYTTDRVGNVLEIVEEAACTLTPLVLESQTVTTPETFTSCSSIEAGNGFAVESPGDVRFEAVSTIALGNGFSVGAGARFEAASGGDPTLSVRTYGYQVPQYFLTSADGPWGELDWTYDRIGNRLTETRNGGNPDTYVYLTNGTGNTPILDQVVLGVMGIRDYTWGAAGHLEEVAAVANVLDFGADAEGRLSGVDRTAASETVAFTYDGRSFLRSARETAGGTRSVAPLYDSAGLVHALRRRASPTDPDEVVVFLYLAGRPVAQLAIDGTGTESWTYLTTDHLGAPLLAADDAGAVTWDGGFEPFGEDYQQGTMAGALDHGLYLRLPGQWDDGTWSDASSGARITYNLMRWLEPGTGRYTRPDPLGVEPLSAGLEGNPNLYAYAASNPLLLIDPRGLAVYVCSRKAFVTKMTPRGLGNHSYLWDPRPGVPPDESYCGIFSDAREQGPSMDACNIVPGSDGREDQVMECCRFLKKHQGWFYLPPINDCQTGTSRALDCAGLRDQHPGVPGGRVGLPCDQCNIAPPSSNPCPPQAATRLRGMSIPACQQ